MQIRNGFDSLFWSGLKTVRKITFFGVKSGQDLGGTPPGRIPGSTPPPPGDTQSTLSQQIPSENGYLKMVPAFLQSVPLTTL